MKFRPLASLFLALILFLPLSVTAVLAYTVPSDTVVYVTDSGTKYHRLDCTHLHSSRSITIERAKRAGYEPCSRCNPDYRTGRYVPDLDGNSGSSSSSSRRSSSAGSSRSSRTPEKEPPIFFAIMSTIFPIIWFIVLHGPTILVMALFSLACLASLCYAIIEKIKRFKNRK